MFRLPSRITVLTVSAAVTLSVALAAFAYLGSFIRHIGDDWCTAAVINKDGLLQAQWKWYVGWTGRFSFTLASGIAHLSGPRAAPFIPALMLALWLVAACWAAYQVAVTARWPRPLLSSPLAAEFVVFVTLNTAHNVVQSFYWQTGALTYVAPLILLTFYVGLVVYGVRRRPAAPPPRLFYPSRHALPASSIRQPFGSPSSAPARGVLSNSAERREGLP
jgi:hypothetical protein